MRFSCKKIPYESREEARHVRRRVAAARGNKGNSIYRCKHCGRWHLGRKRKDQRTND